MGMYGNDIKIQANKDELLAILRKNRETHIADFKEACDGYKTAALEALEKRLAAFGGTVKGEPIPKGLNLDFSNLPKPHSHEKDYDRAIKMLEMHQGDTFTIDMAMYTQYVEDSWDWKGRFEASNSIYKG